jgi:hypothetical protein
MMRSGGERGWFTKYLIPGNSDSKYVLHIWRVNMTNLADPYDYVDWNPRPDSISAVRPSRQREIFILWQECGVGESYGKYSRTLLSTFDLIKLLALCAIIFTILRHVLF